MYLSVWSQQFDSDWAIDRDWLFRSPSEVAWICRVSCLAVGSTPTGGQRRWGRFISESVWRCCCSSSHTYGSGLQIGCFSPEYILIAYRLNKLISWYNIVAVSGSLGVDDRVILYERPIVEWIFFYRWLLLGRWVVQPHQISPCDDIVLYELCFKVTDNARAR